jgi:hypothetical protein
MLKENDGLLWSLVMSYLGTEHIQGNYVQSIIMELSSMRINLAFQNILHPHLLSSVPAFAFRDESDSPLMLMFVPDTNLVIRV